MNKSSEMLKWEILKKLKSKVGIVLAILFILISAGCIFLKPSFETDNAHYEMGRKIVDTRPPQQIANEKFNVKVNSIKMLLESKESGQKNSDKTSEKDGIKKYSQQKLDNIKHKEYKDVKFWQAFNQKATHPLIIVYLIAFITLIFSTLYTDEIISGVDNLILSSKNKYKVLRAKITFTIMSTVIVYMMYLIIQFIAAYFMYGPPKNGDLQAFRILDVGFMLKGAMSIQNYIALKIGISLLIMITVALLAVLFSFITTNSLASITAFGIIFIVPKFMSVVKIIPAQIRVLLDQMNFYDLLISPHKFVGMYLGRISFLNFSFDTNNFILAVIVTIAITTLVTMNIKFKKLTVNK
ncbi:hypothetical protein ACFIJ5_14630 [Haloimpatiens sp. FM7330]|uniref:hypothetical protein n=1 Tax=Haloimpatiens sp. FM7330 TaxID=3298610 RepID=UPI00362671D4